MQKKTLNIINMITVVQKNGLTIQGTEIKSEDPKKINILTNYPKYKKRYESNAFETTEEYMSNGSVLKCLYFSNSSFLEFVKNRTLATVFVENIDSIERI